MGDKVVFVCHILFRLKGSQLSETHQHTAGISLKVYKVETCLFWRISLSKSLIIAHHITIARHQYLQTAIAEGCSPAAITAHMINRPSYLSCIV